MGRFEIFVVWFSYFLLDLLMVFGKKGVEWWEKESFLIFIVGDSYLLDLVKVFCNERGYLNYFYFGIKVCC